MSTLTARRRVRNFTARAQAQLSAEDWAGGDATILCGNVWIQRGMAKTHVRLDEYNMASAHPVIVRQEAINRLRAQARDPRYTAASKAADAAYADDLEQTS